jgi:hypothetical protein
MKDTAVVEQSPNGVAVDTGPPDPWEGEVVVDEETFVSVLADAIRAIERAEIPYLLMGGIGSATHGRPRWTHDIDFFVRPEQARPALRALEKEGFDTLEYDPNWLFKGLKNNTLVDVIFRSKGDIYLDEEMLQRAQPGTFKGQKGKTIAPEDLLVIKAVVHDEHIPRHWHDALAIISQAELDWEYLIHRARQHGTRRVLSLLTYAQSNDLMVPNSVVQELFQAVYG